MNPDDLLARLTDVQTVASTLYGEARGERIEGRIAVADVIRNRVSQQRSSYGLGWKAVCLKAWQFSCWLPQGGRANYDLTMDTARILDRGEYGGPKLRECLWIAEGVIGQRYADSVKGSTHYLTTKLLHEHPPEWAIGIEPRLILGSHAFFAGVK